MCGQADKAKQFNHWPAIRAPVQILLYVAINNILEPTKRAPKKSAVALKCQHEPSTEPTTWPTYFSLHCAHRRAISRWAGGQVGRWKGGKVGAIIIITAAEVFMSQLQLKVLQSLKFSGVCLCIQNLYSALHIVFYFLFPCRQFYAITLRDIRCSRLIARIMSLTHFSDIAKEMRKKRSPYFLGTSH